MTTIIPILTQAEAQAFVDAQCKASPFLDASDAQKACEKTVATIIVTGGTGNGDNMSEAAAGASYLEERGVPTTAILLETNGRSTYQSLKAAAALAQASNIQSVLLVSDPFHMLRSLKMAGDLGFTAYPSPTTTSPISRRPLEEWLYMIREAVAYTSYLFTNQ
jgi:uncharacterized SAM-binding protein YcdF (DUF218 family)